MNKKIIIISTASALLVISAIIFSVVRNQNDATAPATAPQSQEQAPLTKDHTNESEAEKQLDAEESFDKDQYSLSDPTSIWVIVNKQRPLNPTDFVPPSLITPDVALRLAPSAEQSQISLQASQAVKDLFTAAKTAGHQLQFGSGYRSYDYQKQLYDGYVANMGQAEADKISARPGTSEHQTGLSFDVTLPSGECFLETCLGDLPEGKWVAENGYKFGWIIRYPQGKQDVTGYTYEPWHLRYVGVGLATEMHQQNIETLEEFFNL